MKLHFSCIGWGRGTIALRQLSWLVLLLLSVAQSLHAQSFVHPGLLHKQADFDRMKAKVDAGAQPWKAGWDVLVANSNSSLTRNFTNPIPATVYRGFDGTNTENYASLFRDAAAAYQTALRWKISGDDAYAAKSIAILNAWATGMTAISGTADRFLLAGIQGYQLANAAEIMRSYSGWAPADFAKFKNWMLTVWYPMNHDFLVNHNGACISNYYANWDLCNMASVLSIGVLCDRRDIYNEAVEYFKNGAGTGSIKNVVPYLYGELGQWQESGRDQGHTLLGVALAGSFAEMAWNQGDDLYGYDDNRLLKGFEYIAKYNLGYEVPFTTYRNCTGVVQTIVSEDQRGNLRPVWEMVYNHYVNRKGLSAPYSARFAQLVRPEGGGGNFGPNSGGYDQLGFGTLTASLEETVKPNNQTISFPTIPTKEVGSADFSPGATASSGLPVVYSSLNPTIASVNADGTIHVSKPGTATIVAQQMGNSQYNLAPVVYQVFTINQIPGVTDGTWSNTAGILATAITSTAGSADLTWPGQTFAVGDHVRLTGTVPAGFTANTNYAVVATNGSTIQLSLRPGGAPIVATTTITNGTGNRFLKWPTAANWSGSIIPAGVGSNATFGGGSFSNIGGVQLDGVVTVGTLTYAANGTGELTLASGLNGGTLTFQALSGMPLLTMINSGARKLFMGNANGNSRVPLKIAGTQGLKITTPIYGSSGSFAGLRIQSAMDWSGLQGSLNLAQGTIEIHNPNSVASSITDADNVILPPIRLTMGTDATALLLFNGASYASKQTIGALDGTSDAYIASRTNIVNGVPTLVVGVDNQNGTFEGTIGAGPTTAAVDKGRINLEKTGTGTQTITGVIRNGTTTVSNVPYYSTVAVNNGKLVLNGANEYVGATTVNGGTLVVNGSLASLVSVTAGTLAGVGLTSGSVTVGSGAFIAPGNSVGVFTTTSVLSLTSGATYQLELNSSASTADKLVANGVSLNGANLVAADLGNASSLPVGTTYVIIDNTSSSAVSGTFAGLAEGSFVTIGSIRFQITYQGGTGNDVVLTVSQRSQTITFNALPAKTVGDADFNPGATASSGLLVSYISSNTAVATIVNGNIHIVGVGSTTITASQAGDATFVAASSVAQILLVRAGVSVTILHRDVDNYADNNAIQPLIQIQNQGANALSLSRLTLRYYVTVENAATLGNLSINYAQVGSQTVRLRYVPLNPIQQGAQGYVEYSFTEGAGNLAAGANSGSIQTYLTKSDYGSLYEPDDYSYATVRNQLVNNLRITAYYDGVLVAGLEPGSTAQIRALRALTESKNGPSATQINTYLEIRNEGNVPINYSDLKARYYFTSDGNERLLTEVDEGNVTAQLVKTNSSLVNADTYLELSFNQGGQLAPGASTGTTRYRISKPDGGRFNQVNDYSYQEQPLDRSQNSRVVIYVANQRAWGQEPASGSRLAAERTDSPLTLTVLGNPVVGDQATVEIRGATGQRINLTLTDLNGKSLFEQQIESVTPGQQQVIPMSRQAGTYLLRATSDTERATIKLIKP
jgi:autotransporter-associated beta strand protein